MIGAKDLLPPLQELDVQVVGSLVIAAPADRVGQPGERVQGGDVLRPLDARQLVE